MNDLERVQKSAIKIILQESYKGYKKGLAQLGIDTLESRREQLCLSFAQKCVKSKKLNVMFPKNSKLHFMNTRYEEHFEVQHANMPRRQYRKTEKVPNHIHAKSFE